MGRMTESEAKCVIAEYKPMIGFPRYKEALEVASKAIDDVQVYRAIGTVEEFKDLKEKSKPKKAEYQAGHEKCPTCGSFHVFGRYCSLCGQKVVIGCE